MKPLSCLFVLLGILVLSVLKTSRCERVGGPPDLPCPGAGAFSIPGSCDSYYVCRPWGQSLYAYPANCDPGTIFDEASKECVSPSTIDQSSPCVADVADDTSKTSGDGEIIPSNIVVETEEVPSVVETEEVPSVVETEEVPYVSLQNAGSCDSINYMGMCDNVNMLNRYSTLVISNPFLRENLENQGKLSIDAEIYNRDLKTAKTNIQPWNNGDSILIGINQIYQLVAQYAMEFSRKYGIYQENAGDVSKQGTNKAFIKMLEGDIKKLQEDIEASEDGLRTAELPMLIEYFTNNIKFLQQKKGEKEQQVRQENSGGAKATRDLEDLSYFIDLVKKNARNIEDLANDSSGRVKILLDNLEADFDKFDGYKSESTGEVKALTDRLTKEREEYENTVSNINDETERLDEEIENLQNLVQIINEDDEEIDVKIKELEKKMEAERDKYDSILGEACKDMKTKFWEMASCIKAIQSSSLDLDQERKDWSKFNVLRTQNLNNITSIKSLISENKQERHELAKSLPSADLGEQEETELGRLGVFLSDVENLKGNVDSSMSSLDEIMKVLQGFACHFGDIKDQLSLLTERANTAENDQDKQTEKAIIEQDVSRVEAQVQKLSSELSGLEECI